MDIKFGYNEMISDDSTAPGVIEIEGNLDNLRGKVCSEIVYATKDGVDLHLRILKPQGLDNQKSYPLILFVQGSAWMKQNLDEHIMDLYPLVTNGYIVAIVEYRDSSIAPFPAQIIDTKTAMRYLMANGKQWDIDLDNVFVAGDSSGGHTALGCWATWYDNRLDDETTPLCPIKGVMDFYGPTNLYTMPDSLSALDHQSQHSPEGMVIGGFDTKIHKDKSLAASIDTYLHEGMEVVPLLIIHGSKDRYVPFRQSLDFYQETQKFNYDVTMVKINNSDHGGSAFFAPNVYAHILDFLKRNR